MPSSYRSALKHLISYLTIAEAVGMGKGRERKRGGLFEYLEERQLFAVAAQPFTINVPRHGPVTFDENTFQQNFSNTTTLVDVEFVTLPSNGTLLFQGANVTVNESIPAAQLNLVTYTPTGGFTGNDVFEWDGSTGGGNFTGTPANITLAVPTNAAPSVSDITIPIPTKNATLFTAAEFSAGFTDPDSGDTLQQVEIATLPTHGNLTLGGANGTVVNAGDTLSLTDLGQLTYTPDPSFTGPDGFTWNGSDGSLFAGSAANVTLTRASITTATYIIPKGPPGTLSTANLTNAFTDVNGDALQNITFLSTPSNGTLTVNGVALTTAPLTVSVSNLTLVYTPNANTVADIIQWEGSANGLTSQSANIVVAILPPKVSDLALTALENQSLAISTAQLENDFSTLSQANATVFEVTSLPTHGVLMVNGVAASNATLNTPIPLSNLTLTYTPNAGSTASDTIGFTESLDGITFPASSANISITVVGPTAQGSNITVGENRTHVFSNTDFAFTSSLTDAGFSPTTFRLVTLPAHGTLIVDGTTITSAQLPRTVSYSNLTVSYVPKAGFTGADSFSWTLSADGTLFATAVSTGLTVTAPVASGFSEIAGTGLATTIPVSDFSSHFSSQDGGTLQVVKITKLPTHGTLTLGGAAVKVGQAIPVGALGTLHYTSKAGYVGPDAFIWTGADGAAVSGAATVTLSVLTPFGVLGNGNPILQKTAPTVTNFTDFGSWTLGAASSADPGVTMQADIRTYTIRNSSAANITLSNIVLGGNVADFVIVSQPGSLSLAPGATTTFTLQFRPVAAGKRVATVTIGNSGAAGPFVFTIQGTGLITNQIATSLENPQTQAVTSGIVQEGTTQRGSGVAATNGHIVSIKYTGYLANGGNIFDSTAAHGNIPLTFRLDDTLTQTFLSSARNNDFGLNGIDGGVIAGWEYALQGIKAGEKRTFVIDGNAAYGATGQVDSNGNPVLDANGNPVIPPNSTLIFDIQCVAVDPKPQVGVVAFDSNGTPFAQVSPGETQTTADLGTLLTLSNTSVSSTIVQRYQLLTLGATNSSGTPLSNWTFTSAKEPVTLSGHNKADFSIGLEQVSNGWVLTVTFHPLTTGVKNETVHIHTNDPLHRDFTFNVKGTSTAYEDVTPGFDPTLFLPKKTVISGSGQLLRVPVTMSSVSDAPLPAVAKTNIQIYATNTSTGAKMLVGFVNGISLGGLEVKGIKRFYPNIALPKELVSGTYTFTAVVNQSAPSANATISGLITLPTVWNTMVQGAGSGANQTMTDNDSVDTSTFVSKLAVPRAITVVQGSYALGGNLASPTVVATAAGATSGSIGVTIQNLGSIFTLDSQHYSIDIVAHALDNSADITLVNSFIASSGHVAVDGTQTVTVPVTTIAGTLPAGTYLLQAKVTLLEGNNVLAGPTTIAVDKNFAGVLLTVT